MLTLVFAAVLAFFIPRLWRKIWPKDNVSAFLVGLLTVMLGLMTALLLNNALPTNDVAAKPVAIAALRSGSDLGWGRSGKGSRETQVFQLFIANADGSFRTVQIPADDRVKIIEKASLKDSGLWVTTRRVADRQSFLAYWTLHSDETDDVVEQTLYVPVGTVKGFAFK